MTKPKIIKEIESKLDASDLKDASLSEKGIVQLSNELENSEDKAATPKSVKSVDDKLVAHSAEKASTTKVGHVQLNDNTNSTSTTQAATANAVKKAFDRAVAVDTNLSELQQQLTEHLAENATGAHSPKNVGLGNVQNYGVATQTEAESGTSNSKYMTPQRTKQAIDKISKEVVNRQTSSKTDVDPNIFSNLRSGEVLLCKHANAPDSTNWWQISTYFGVSDINHIQVAINWSNPSDVIYIRKSTGENVWSDWRSILEGFTMKGILKAHPNTSYTVPQVRNVSFGTSEPTGGNDGDIYFQYE